MSKKSNPESAQALDQKTLELLGSELQPVALPAERMQKLRTRVMQRIDNEKEANLSLDLVTIRSDEGPWVEIAPGLRKKVLHFNPDTGEESYLLRAEPGAQTPPHDHEFDELCLVLEGDVAYDNVKLKAGDYHFAPKGSHHSTARTINGTLVFLQNRIAA